MEEQQRKVKVKNYEIASVAMLLRNDPRGNFPGDNVYYCD